MEDEFAGNQHSNHDCSNEKNIDNVLASHIPLPLRMDLETDLAVRLVLSLGRCQRKLLEAAYSGKFMRRKKDWKRGSEGSQRAVSI